MIDFISNNFPFIYLTQPLWRDEAFSVLLSQNNPFEIVYLTAQDFTPPVYYLFLHGWMLLFGTSEIAVRSLSLVFYIASIMAGWFFAKKNLQFIHPSIQWGVAILLATAPMLIYYGFEARAYSLIVLLSILSMHFFLLKKWGWYIVLSTLMLYTHPYTGLILIVQGIWTIFQKDRKLIKKVLMNLLIIGVLFLPWIIVYVKQLSSENGYWFFPVDLQLVKSVLGNLYIGYEGTPWFLWRWTYWLSLLLGGIFYFVYWNAKKKDITLLLLMWVFIPLTIVIAISFFKPLYVNRYVIFVTPAMVLMVSCALYSVKNSWVRNGILTGIVGLTIYFSFWYSPYIKKEDFRTSLKSINEQISEQDLIVVEDPLYYFNVRYYTDERFHVKTLISEYGTLPAYLGDVLIPSEVQLSELPTNTTIYFVTKNGEYVIIKGLKEYSDG